jgi:hypothetical protein
MTAEDQAKAVRSLGRTALIMTVAGAAAIVFGLLGKSTSLSSEPGLARVDFGAMLLGGLLAFVIGGSAYLILRISNRP